MSDKLYQKRKRAKKELLRKNPKQKSFERILIVCEGEKTEPFYLTSLKTSLRLNSAEVKICGKECGSDPRSIFNYAKSEYAKARNNNPYDKVFCVFDKDKHTDFEEIKNLIPLFKPKDVFIAITSIPCFEYFLLLHFKYTTRPFSASGNKSVCDCVIGELKNYIPNYKKSYENIYRETNEKLDDALSNCKKVNEEAENLGTDNPTTRMYELVEYLRNLET